MSRPASAVDHLEKAKRALASCYTLLNTGDPEGACNRAYYAMFNAAHAALQSVGAAEPGTIYKSHSGLISAFSKDVVLPGKVDRELGRALSKVYETRLVADYTGDPPKEEDARWAAAQADAFVSTIAERFSGADQ